MKSKSVKSKLVKLVKIMFAAAMLLFLASPSFAISRSELRTQILAALRADASAYANSADTGNSQLTEFFASGDGVTRQEALDMALSAMGLSFERNMASRLRGTGCTVTETMQPFPPAQLVTGLEEPLSDSDIPVMTAWLGACKSGFSWEAKTGYDGVELFIRRTGVGHVTRGGGFVLQMDTSDIDTLKTSVEAAGKQATVVGTAGGPLLQVGPYPTAAAAMEAAAAHPEWPQATCVDLGASKADAIYYAVVRVDLTRYSAGVEFAERISGKGRIPMSEFYNSSPAVVVVNGGYFAGSRPLGTTLVGGMHTGKPLPGRSAVGWNASGSIAFGNGFARVGLMTPSGMLEFTNYSKAPEDNGLALLVQTVASSYGNMSTDAAVYHVVGGGVQPMQLGTRELMGNFAVAARGRSQQLMGTGLSNIDIRTEWQDSAFSGCTDVIQGGPMLLRNGNKLNATEGITLPVINQRHPRTVIGSDGRSMILLIVDGRNELHSRGDTMEELAERCRALGMTQAVNMDGGGSTQLMWNGVTVNMPSDGKERPLPYVLKLQQK